MNRFFKLFLIVFVYILAFASISYAGFSDIENHWAKEKIEDFLESGFVDGYGDGTFRPDQDITRAEFCKIINAYMGYGFSEESGENVSGEIVPNIKSGETNEWKEKNFKLANEKGYLQVGNVDEKLSREEAFVALSKVMNLSNIEYELNYDDASEISVWAIPAVKALASANHIKGYGGKLRPKENLTRAELVSVLYDFVGIGGLDDEPQDRKFEIGLLVHDEYGLVVKKLVGDLEMASGDSVTFAVMLEENESEPEVKIVSGDEYVELDKVNLILDAKSSGEALINFTTDKHDENVKVIIK